ncbi:MAG: acyl-CoA desaturase [Myxococcales bacterium]
MELAKITLTPEQIEAFGAELQALEERTRAKLGAEDAAHIRKIMKLAQNLDTAGRALLLASLFPPAWLAGTTMLGVAKILDNMEIGHNVMHGQYDFMKDPVINTNYEWDTVAPSEQWRHGHNYVHHTFTNVLGLDHDIGYRVARLSEEQPWHPKWLLGNVVNTFFLATFFEWGVGVHDVNAADAYFESDMSKLEVDLIPALVKKISRQVLKDYVLFPVLAGPMAAPVLAGNVVANLIRNYWTWAVIYCGHFPDGTVVFTEDQIRNETRGQWYLRQMMGSANIEGSHALHVMTGHLSHQIEHHLFPTIPAWRYPEMGVEVKAIAEKYGVPYTTGSFGKQLRSVFKRIARLSLPLSVDDALNWRKNAEINARMKTEGHEVLKGKRKPGYHAPRAVKMEKGAASAKRMVTSALKKSQGWLSRVAA